MIIKLKSIEDRDCSPFTHSGILDLLIQDRSALLGLHQPSTSAVLAVLVGRSDLG